MTGNETRMGPDDLIGREFARIYLRALEKLGKSVEQPDGAA